MDDAMKRLHMTVFRRQNRGNYVIRWKDKIGRWHQETTETNVKRDAFHAAQELAGKILAIENAGGDLEWDTFCDLYESRVISRRSGRAPEPWDACRRWVDRLGPPAVLSEITTAWVATWQHRLRKADVQRRPKKPKKGRDGKLQPDKPPKFMSENTVASYSARLKAALNWAAEQGFIDRAPRVNVEVEEVPRSRAITLEEFERLLLAIPKVRPIDFACWDRLLRGQWHCGYRISEMVAISWDRSAPVHIDAAGRFPIVSVAARSNKKRKPRIRAMTPEFWAVCCETPPNNRKGLVFPVANGCGGNMSLKRIVKIISKIGKRAGIVTNPETGKLATSHDTRRGFACQMDGRGLSLAELQKWMDHADIRTTLTYYRTAEADQLAEKVWNLPPGQSSDVSSDRPGNDNSNSHG